MAAFPGVSRDVFAYGHGEKGQHSQQRAELQSQQAHRAGGQPAEVPEADRKEAAVERAAFLQVCIVGMSGCGEPTLGRTWANSGSSHTGTPWAAWLGHKTGTKV